MLSVLTDLLIILHNGSGTGEIRLVHRKSDLQWVSQQEASKPSSLIENAALQSASVAVISSATERIAIVYN